MRDQPDPRSAEDQIIDRYLDGDLLPDESCELFDSLRSDPARSRELFAMQRAIQSLGEPVQSPDFTKPILKAVGRRRGLVSAPARRLFTVGRVAAAVALMATFAGIYTVHRFAPGVTSPGVAQSSPIADLSAGVSGDVPEVIDTFKSAIGERFAQLEPGDVEVEVAEMGDPAPFPALSFTSADVGPSEFSTEIDPLIARSLVASGVVAVAPEQMGPEIDFGLMSSELGLPRADAIATGMLGPGMPGVVQRPNGTITLMDAGAILDAGEREVSRSWSRRPLR